MPGSSPEVVEDAEVETKVDAEATETKTDVSPAESSPAEPKSEKGDMLSAVKAALKPKTGESLDPEKPGPQSETAAEGDANKEGDPAADESDDLTDEEFQRLKPKTRARIENLNRKIFDRDRRIAEMEPAAQSFEQITKFVSEAGLTKDEVNDGFAVMRDLKRNPLQAYERLKPIMAQLSAMAGDTLPPDLQVEVDYGRMLPEHAKSLARNRSEAAISRSSLQHVEQTHQTRQQTEAHQAHVSRVAEGVAAWERTQGKTDPDWKLKQPRVQELTELEILRRQRKDPGFFPKTVEEAVEITKSSLEIVNKEFRKVAPQRREIRPSPEAVSTRSTAKPTSMLEAAKAGLARAAGQ